MLKHLRSATNKQKIETHSMRAKSILEMQCPDCKSRGHLYIHTYEIYVWVECVYCRATGYKEKMKDNKFIKTRDLLYTIADSMS